MLFKILKNTKKCMYIFILALFLCQGYCTSFRLGFTNQLHKLQVGPFKEILNLICEAGISCNVFRSGCRTDFWWMRAENKFSNWESEMCSALTFLMSTWHLSWYLRPGLWGEQGTKKATTITTIIVIFNKHATDYRNECQLLRIVVKVSW